MTRELAPKLVVIFRYLVKGGCWRLADVVPVSKNCSSSDVGNYEPISIAPLLSKVFEKMVAGKLGHFLKSKSASSFLIFVRRGLGTRDALQFFSDRRQLVRLDGKVSASVNVVSRML